ncbi:glutamate--cysteine ligase [Streptomyces sp. NPDC058623]|uniref:carboxylate-amine ligase n=1 Tax=Streptomyces sp. NPDC058623 TaxID=3346563 RepID=UPI003666283A
MDVPTVGVEEEYLLVDRGTRAPVNRGPQVIRAAARELGELVQSEFYDAQVEICTRPTTDCADLRRQLSLLRESTTRAARAAGCLPVASGVPVIAPLEPLTVTDDERYRRMARRSAHLIDGFTAVCGCHIHVGTMDRPRALALASHMRPWLPVLQSLTGNSPLMGGRDTGHDSWRSVAFSCWPTVGPPPVVDEAQYLAHVDGLVAAGVLLDRRMLYWYARPSEHVPTLEIRVSDVNADLDTVILTVALVRGLAAVLLEDVDAGVPPPTVPPHRLWGAHALAARGGLDGPGADPCGRGQLPAELLVERLLDRAAPGLAAAGDLDLARTLWEGLRRRGTGASRQRAVLAATGSLTAVVDRLAVAPADVPLPC